MNPWHPLLIWNWHSAVWVVIPALAIAYACFVRPANRWRTALFIAGLLFLLVALASPVDVLANGYLFSAHMVQHLLLLLAVPPLLLLSLPRKLCERWANKPALRFIEKHFAHPPASWIAGIGAMWVWHVPTLCSAAATNTSVQIVQFVTLLLAGTLFWWPVAAPVPNRRLSHLPAALYLFTACVGCTLLGIYITFSPISVCPAFQHPTDALGILTTLRDQWGMNPRRDQQVGGLLMWLPACLVYVTAIMSLIARWYSGEPAEEPKTDIPESAAPHAASLNDNRA